MDVSILDRSAPAPTVVRSRAALRATRCLYHAWFPGGWLLQDRSEFI